VNRPPLKGVIERRLLVNYRADPEAVAAQLPPGFRPQLVDGAAVAGICLVRFGALRPPGVSPRLGLRSENAAHRFAVEWDTDAGAKTGVYISRRFSDALVNVLAGGRLYPGVHHRADFQVDETPREVRVAFTARDGSGSVAVEVERSETLHSSLFADLHEASEFFRLGSAGLSPALAPRTVEGLELHAKGWAVHPLAVRSARSSLFDDPAAFPPGSIQLDCALLMLDTPVVWRTLPSRSWSAHAKGVPA
jgi:Uncharacterized conserved protein (COG2071)